MRLDVPDVVEVWLPEFDNAVVIRRYQPLLAMRIYGGSNCRVVGLERSAFEHITRRVEGRLPAIWSQN